MTIERKFSKDGKKLLITYRYINIRRPLAMTKEIMESMNYTSVGEYFEEAEGMGKAHCDNKTYCNSERCVYISKGILGGIFPILYSIIEGIFFLLLHKAE